MKTVVAPDHTISLNDTISCYDICGNDFAYNLICVALKRSVSFILVSLPEETGEFAWKQIQELTTDFVGCRALTFSPDTSLNCTPNKVTVCFAMGQRDIRLYHTDFNQYSSVSNLEGHKDFVNDIAWVCEGELLASVSDDFTCRFWTITGNPENVITFCLSSAGMAVKSHPEDPNKVLVAEKRGIIHLYNVRSKQTVVSVESPKFPLMSADWANSNRLFITALAGGDIITWDLSRRFVPVDVKQVHEDGGRAVKFSPSNSEVVIASIGRPDITLKIFPAKSNVPIMEAPLKSYGGLCWHQRLPYVTAASDRNLFFWKVHMK
ncbi:CG11875 [Drosophila busckii]|uniref:CG11875 n=1 Tax=Drosophila busckii TaxID=30019 RepID=A0A0M4EEQ2_DROBS|nr:nucleoporin Nup37 [Drosophila busckii]ALC46516.1 CG11875 [Drosophila busckii]